MVEVTVLKETPTKLKVKLPDGNIIVRKKKRDLPGAEGEICPKE